MSFDFAPQLPAEDYAGTGRRFPAVHAPTGEELTTGKLGGPMTYTEMAYAFTMLLGAPATTTPTGATLARQHVWNVPLTGKITKKSFTVEQGDADDSERFPGTLLTGLSLDMQRTGGNKLGGDLLAYPLQKNGSSSFTGMTAGASVLANDGIAGNVWQVWVDDTAAGIGTTLITIPYHVTLDLSGFFSAYFGMNSATTGPSGIGDTVPKGTALIEDIKDPTAGQMESNWGHARAGEKLYFRVQAKGRQIEATTPPYSYLFQADFCATVANPGGTKFTQSTRSREWPLQIMEDASWSLGATGGTAVRLLLINTLTAIP
jgi:hypothetical protein